VRYLALESRRAVEIETLIRTRGGDAFVAPSVREVALESNVAALQFADRLFAGDFDMVIFLTGVGAKLLKQVVETRHPVGMFEEALHEVAVIVRGPKPSGVMREWNVPVAAIAKEPNTWRELLTAIDALDGEGRTASRIAIQEFGRPSLELADALRARGADVTSVPVYQWQLPEDTGPLREAARRLIAGEVDVVVLTAAVQVTHLLEVADNAEAVLEAMRKIVVASIGPTTSESLRELGVTPDFEPSHPKMGILITELAEKAAELVASKAR
jgi:uroporphyrinogen-III synthase